MPLIDISSPHAIAKDVLKARIETLTSSVQRRLPLAWHWDEETMVFEVTAGLAKGTRGTLRADDTTVRARIHLPWALWAFKGRVESTLRRRLARLS
jgi:hypothetical protein